MLIDNEDYIIKHKQIIPHPFPYQGSKRKLASQILSYLPKNNRRMFEPFAGSAAITLAAAKEDYAKQYIINDILEPLAKLWILIIDKPNYVADEYEKLWNQANIDNHLEFYYNIRLNYNKTNDPICLLYLLARCVKAAVRFNTYGEFNQSADNRRLGTKPDTMRANLHKSGLLLSGKTIVQSCDYHDILDQANSYDIIYMDPPYQGTSNGTNHRYYQNTDISRLFHELKILNQKSIPYALSFDGMTGNLIYGQEIPSNLELLKIDLIAGTSAQSTLNGRKNITVESLYLSPALVELYDRK